jgi:hypothetical protein
MKHMSFAWLERRWETETDLVFGHASPRLLRRGAFAVDSLIEGGRDAIFSLNDLPEDDVVTNHRGMDPHRSPR